MTGKAPEFKLLVDMLHEAAQLEHCLLDSYLYAACSLKSTPQEFATIGGKVNLRRAIQFERARSWKQSLLTVCHEEMLHLHYVECMLRALGERPYFGLPGRDEKGNWLIPNWKARVGANIPDAQGTEVPISPLTPEYARRLVMFESSNSLQDAGPFDPESMALYKELHAFEMELHVEGIVSKLTDAEKARQLREALLQLYATTPTVEEEARAFLEAAVAAAAPELPPLEKLIFPSIADFYEKGILPLYEQAFAFGWVKNTNLGLVTEQQDPNYGAEGFLPVPIPPRSQHSFENNQANTLKPFTRYKHVRSIVEEIVQQGEGVKNFSRRARAMLAKVKELGGAAKYLEYVNNDLANARPNPSDPNYKTPAWLYDAQNLRQSHLYLFAMIMVELEQERTLATQSGVEFVPAREPANLGNNGALVAMTEELPGQLNACYLVMLAWLSRMYETREWASDRRERMPIEALATWPLMSLAIRPLLELASCLPLDPSHLFRTDGDALPMLPVLAQQLRVLYDREERSEEINRRMDYLALRVLSSVSDWADERFAAVQEAELAPELKVIILDRLKSLRALRDFEKQFTFRVHGGYSSNLPDLEYTLTHKRGEAYSEDPTALGALFQDSVVLRLRFSGWGLVQLATDPDPPDDEVGCTGTQMLHAADGDRRFDRALVWQNLDPARNIVREPRSDLGPLGVDVVDLTLMVADGKATAGYVPLSVMSSTGAVQAQGVQMDMQVRNLLPFLSLRPEEFLGAGQRLCMNLEEKEGVRPFLNGNNHLTWRDGEPIDPFILAVHVRGEGSEQPELAFKREIYNQGLRLLEMSPLQRAQSLRGPVGFDRASNLPAWALPPKVNELLHSPGYPFNFLAARVNVLASSLERTLEDLQQKRTQEAVDAAVSFAERMYLVSQPKGTTVGWSMAALHYGHTVSGVQEVAKGAELLMAALGQRLGASLALSTAADRKAANSRWLARYTLGAMDTDTLSNFVCGELYVPLAVKPDGQEIRLSKEWRFPAALAQVLAGYVPSLDKPYLSDVKGVSDYQASFALEPAEEGQIRLVWSCSFRAEDSKALISGLGRAAGATQAMSTSLREAFAPR